MRDVDIRRALREGPLAIYASDPDTLVVEELGLCEGESRIDVAVINGYLIGYEIKSARDTLERLPAQAQVYSRVFDFVVIVVHERHFQRVIALVPEWWGISVASHRGPEDIEIHEFRPAQQNPGRDPAALVKLLWRDEALSLLRSIGKAWGVASKPRDVIWERLALVLSLDELGAAVRGLLKARGDWRSAPSPSPCGD
jgi:hypothetical protein